jgi:hypothetical protein
MASRKRSRNSNIKTKKPSSRPVLRNAALRRLESSIVGKQDRMSESQFEDMERKVLEDRRQSAEGMGIEEEEDAGEEPYPEIAEALKDPDESEEED